jgi:hypothetical protein
MFDVWNREVTNTLIGVIGWIFQMSKVELIWREKPGGRACNREVLVWGRGAAATSHLDLTILVCQILILAGKARRADHNGVIYAFCDTEADIQFRNIEFRAHKKIKEPEFNA